MPERDRGFYPKYNVTRVDNGETVDPATSFTLVVNRDPHAYPALQAYADSVEGENPKLADDLRALSEKAPDYIDADGEPVFANGANS